MNPKISICIPTFNRADLLDQTLQSVADQTKKPFEVLIVDNASTDNSAAIAKRYEKYGFRFIRNETNVGMVENWNVCIRMSKGEYLTFLHSDDLIAPEWYERWSEAIAEHPGIFYTGSIAIINQNNDPQYTCHTFTENRLIKQKDVYREFWTHLSPAIAPTAASIYHQSLFDEKKGGMFDPSYGTEADVIHFLKVFASTDVYYLDRILFTYRSHPAQGFDTEAQLKSLERELSRLDNYFGILKQFQQSHRMSRFFMQYPVFMTLAPATLYLAKGQFTKVNGYYTIARRHFPSLFVNFSDFVVFLRIITFFIGRALFGKNIAEEDRNQLQWLTEIKR